MALPPSQRGCNPPPGWRIALRLHPACVFGIGTALAYAADMRTRWVACCVIFAGLAGCATQEAGGDYGATHSRRLQQPPEPAARCFARNAEEHSSALQSQVTRTRDGAARVLVQVKNGVAYASADIRPAGAASVAAITLMVRASGGQNDLLDALVKGC